MIRNLLYSLTQNAKLHTLYYFFLFSLSILSHIIQHHTINTRQLHLLQHDCVTVSVQTPIWIHLNYFKALRSLFPLYISLGGLTPAAILLYYSVILFQQLWTHSYPAFELWIPRPGLFHWYLMFLLCINIFPSAMIYFTVLRELPRHLA